MAMHELGIGFLVPGYCWGKCGSQGSREACLSSRCSCCRLNAPLSFFPASGENSVLMVLDSYFLWPVLRFSGLRKCSSNWSKQEGIIAHFAGKDPVTAYGVVRTTAIRFWAEITLQTAATCFLPSMSPSFLVLGVLSPTESRPFSPCFRAGGHWQTHLCVLPAPGPSASNW